jgi:hypothetical protein
VRLDWLWLMPNKGICEEGDQSRGLCVRSTGVDRFHSRSVSRTVFLAGLRYVTAWRGAGTRNLLRHPRLAIAKELKSVLCPWPACHRLLLPRQVRQFPRCDSSGVGRHPLGKRSAGDVPVSHVREGGEGKQDFSSGVIFWCCRCVRLNLLTCRFPGELEHSEQEFFLTC